MGRITKNGYLIRNIDYKKADELVRVDMIFANSGRMCDIKPGISHLLEHLLTSTKDDMYIFNKLENKYHCNAYTYDNSTVYTFSISRKIDTDLIKNFSIYFNNLFRNDITLEELEKEKNIIDNEIGTKDNLSFLMDDLENDTILGKGNYNFYTYKEQRDELPNITLEDLYDFRSNTYIADNFECIIVGEITDEEWNSINEIIKNQFNKINNISKYPDYKRIEYKKDLHWDGRTICTYHKDSDDRFTNDNFKYVRIVYKADDIICDNKNSYMEDFTYNILTDTKFPIHQKLRDLGIYSLEFQAGNRALYYDNKKSTNTFYIYIHHEDDKVLDKAIEIICGFINNPREYISKEYFENIKKSVFLNYEYTMLNKNIPYLIMDDKNDTSIDEVLEWGYNLDYDYYINYLEKFRNQILIFRLIDFRKNK